MSKLIWHHKPDLSFRDQEIIRNVYFGDAVVGRIMQIQHGPQKGTWKWDGRWGGLYDGKPMPGSGRCEDRGAVLSELRETMVTVANKYPRALLVMFDGDPFVRDVAENYLEELLARG